MAHTTKPEVPAAVDLGSLFDYRDGATVTLVARDTQLVAHRAVLAARSPVFHKMLYCQVTGRSGDAEVAVPDVAGEVLRELLVYVYSLRAPRLAGMASRLLTAAHKYGLTELKAQCEEHLATRLTVETAACTAVIAIENSCDILLEAITKFIRDRVFQVMATVGWRHVLTNNPDSVAELSRRLGDLWAGNSPSATTDGSSCRGDRYVAPAVEARRAAPPLRTATSRARNVPEKPEWCELVQAAEKGTVEEVRALLMAGVDVQERERSSWTVLHWAASRGDVEMADCLLEAGADVNYGSRVWETPLHVAAREGHAAVARLLAAAGADLCARDVDGRTPVQRAMLCGHGDVVTALLEIRLNGFSFSSVGAFSKSSSPDDMTWWSCSLRLL